MTKADVTKTEGLRRELGLVALVATAVCTVIGGGINILVVEIQGEVPGIGSLVPLAFVLGAVPAFFTALSYAVLASAMPRAGGDYIYISRALHPFIGFLAAFSKWFGLATACGLIAYLDVSLLKAAATYAGWPAVTDFLSSSGGRLVVPLVMLWLFWLINILGVRKYGVTVIVLMILMLAGGVVLIGYGIGANHSSWAAGARATGLWTVVGKGGGKAVGAQGGWGPLLKATAVLFFAYIGFGSVSQAGGEAQNPTRVLPRAFVLALTIITAYYFLFSSAVYHAVPWQWVVASVKAQQVELSAPELIGVLMPKPLAVFVALMAAVALANDIPPMLLATSRFFYSWAQDGVFPRSLAAVNARFGTPHWALTASTVIATGVIFECYLHGFFTSVDTIVLALLFTYALIGVSVIVFPYHNPGLYRQVRFLVHRGGQVIIAGIGLVSIVALFAIQVYSDLTGAADKIVRQIQEGISPAYSVTTVLAHSTTTIWLIVVVVGAIIFAVMWRRAVYEGRDLQGYFSTLP